MWSVIPAELSQARYGCGMVAFPGSAVAHQRLIIAQRTDELVNIPRQPLYNRHWYERIPNARLKRQFGSRPFGLVSDVASIRERYPSDRKNSTPVVAHECRPHQ